MYYFNYTTFTEVNGNEVGNLIWNLPYTDQDGNAATVSQAMSLVYQPNSNVAAPLFGFDQSTFAVGFDGKNKLFGYDYVDDSTFVAGTPPTSYDGKAYCESGHFNHSPSPSLPTLLESNACKMPLIGVSDMHIYAYLRHSFTIPLP